MLDKRARGRGVGTALLGALLGRLAALGVHRAIAMISLPNEASVALHRRLGYEEVGVFTEVGHKLGRYWAVILFKRAL